jgi:hypothetical protein
MQTVKITAPKINFPKPNLKVKPTIKASMPILQLVVRVGIPTMLAIIVYASLRPYLGAEDAVADGGTNWGQYASSAFSFLIGIIAYKIVSPYNFGKAPAKTLEKNTGIQVLFALLTVVCILATIIVQMSPTFLYDIGTGITEQEFSQAINTEVSNWITAGIIILSALMGFIHIKAGVQMGILITATGAIISGKISGLAIFSLISLVPALGGSLLRFILVHASRYTKIAYIFIYKTDWSELVVIEPKK